MTDQVTQAKDPTKAILSESALDDKFLCDYVVNVATGCRHSCTFCYVPSTPNIRTRPDMLKEHADVDNPQQEWGEYVLYREDIPDELPGTPDRKRTWKETDGGQGIVGISFSTDCFMDNRAAEITASAITTLAEHGRYSRILTRNPMLALNYLDAFHEAGEYVTVGSSISSLDPHIVGAVEPQTPTPEMRLTGLEQLSDAGVQTFVSLSPTYPHMSRDDLNKLLVEVSERIDPDVMFHEPMNPRGGNFKMVLDAIKQMEGADVVYEDFKQLTSDSSWVEYAVQHFYWVQSIALDEGIPIHLWPDQDLLNLTDGRVHDWLAAWKSRQPPEDFAGRPGPVSSSPSLPPEREIENPI